MNCRSIIFFPSVFPFFHYSRALLWQLQVCRWGAGARKQIERTAGVKRDFPQSETEQCILENTGQIRLALAPDGVNLCSSLLSLRLRKNDKVRTDKACWCDLTCDMDVTRPLPSTWAHLQTSNKVSLGHVKLAVRIEHTEEIDHANAHCTKVSDKQCERVLSPDCNNRNTTNRLAAPSTAQTTAKQVEWKAKAMEEIGRQASLTTGVTLHHEMSRHVPSLLWQ